MPVFFIEGNIGVGKTTLIKALKELNPDWSIILEPVDEWVSSGLFDKDLTGLTSDELATHYYNLQRMILDSMMKLKFDDLKTVTIVERSVYSSVYIFAKFLRNESKMKIEDWAKLRDSAEAYLKTLDAVPNYDIYFVSAYEKCMDNIKKRARKGEEGITLDYLRTLDFLHNATFVNCDLVVNTFQSYPSESAQYVSDWIKSKLNQKFQDGQ